MAEHRFHLVVDLLGNRHTEFDVKLLKGREHNHTASGSGLVRNSRDYEFGYTLHKDARRAARRVWKLIVAENEQHAAVYIRTPEGKMEPVLKEDAVSVANVVPESPVMAENSPLWLKSLKAAMARWW